MKLHVRHAFECTPETFWKMYWDDTFDAMLRRDSTVHQELIAEEEDRGVKVRRLRFTPEKELPAPLAKLIGSKKLIYDQENRFDASKGELNWEVIPTFLPGKLVAKGTFVVRPIPGGCERIVEGNIDVKVRFIGGQIEKGVVSEIVATYDRTTQICREWLAKHS